MSNYSQFRGFLATKSIVNAFSDGSTSVASISALGGKGIASGALTANTLATVLSISGRVEMNMLALHTADTTSRTIRLQVIADGTTVFDSTSDAITVSGQGIAAASQPNTTGSLPSYGGPIRCLSTLVVKVASSLSETDKLTLRTNYQTL